MSTSTIENPKVVSQFLVACRNQPASPVITIEAVQEHERREYEDE